MKHLKHFYLYSLYTPLPQLYPSSIKLQLYTGMVRHKLLSHMVFFK